MKTDDTTHHYAQVPAGLNAGETFHDHGREYVVIRIPEDGSLIASEVVRMVPTDLQDPHPNNRKKCNPHALAELVESIRTKGQTTTAILRKMPDGRLQQIAGWRRALACAELGIPLRAHVREMTDVEALEQLYLENAQREDLRPLDEAELIEAMLDLRDGENRRLFTLERVAIARYGSARPGAIAQVRQKRLLLQLPEALKEAVNSGELKLNIAWLVARIADPADREEAGKKVLKDPMTSMPMTFKRAGEMIRATYQVVLKGWPHMERTDLLTDEQKAAMGFTGKAGEKCDGSCERCPFLAKNHDDYKDELSAAKGSSGSGESGIFPTTCTRARCHQMKLENLWQTEAAELAKKHNAKVLPRDFDDVHLYSTLDMKPNGRQLGDWEKARDPKLLTWKQILKGSDVPLVVMPDEDDAGDIIPVLAVEDALAIQVGKEKHPDLFANARVPGQTTGAKGDIKTLNAKKAAGELTEDEKKALEALLAEQEQQRLDQAKREMEQKVKAESKADCFKELLERITAKGAGLDVMKALAVSIYRRADGHDELLGFLTGKPVPEEDDYDENCAAFEKLLRGQTVNGLLGICAVTSVWDDVYYSGVHEADDFAAMCKAAKIDVREIEARVKKAHQLAFRAAEKDRKDKLKAEQRTKVKNSVDPVKVSSEHEADVSAAADAVARERNNVPPEGFEAPLMSRRLGSTSGVPGPEWLEAFDGKAGEYFHCDACGGVCAVGADLVKDVEELPEGEFECEECADGSPIFGTTFPLAANQEDFEPWVPMKSIAEVYHEIFHGSKPTASKAGKGKAAAKKAAPAKGKKK